MGFGLQISNGNILPYIKINGKDGRVERSTYDGQNKGSEIVQDFVALFDWKTLKTGWINFEDNGAPDKHLAAIGDPMPERPSLKHKQGIEIVVFLPGGLGVHEISTTATGVISALEAIYDQSVEASEWSQGKIPVVRLTGFKKEGTGLKARAVPSFHILDWKDRPKEMDEHDAVPRPRAAIGTQAKQEAPPQQAVAAASTMGAKIGDAIPDFG